VARRTRWQHEALCEMAGVHRVCAKLAATCSMW
jgi:hypothetical protein